MARASESPGFFARLGRTWRRHPVLLTLFPAAFVLTLWFAARSLMFALYWADPAHQDQAIAGWMTPRYVSHSWEIPRDVMLAAIGEEPVVMGGHPTLDRIAAAEGIPVAELIRRIETAIADYRAGPR